MKQRLTPNLTTGQVIQALRNRHPWPEWVVFEELRVSTGFSKSIGADRYVDLWAMDTYPSKGHKIVGYEIKVSRADFAKEVNDPSKRYAAQQTCDAFYFATPYNLIGLGEVPADSGLVWVTGNGRVRVVKESPKQPAQLSRGFWASVARRIAMNGGTGPTEHYDVAESKRRAVIKAGAVEITPPKLAEILRRKRDDMMIAVDDGPEISRPLWCPHCRDITEHHQTDPASPLAKGGWWETCACTVCDYLVEVRT